MSSGEERSSITLFSLLFSLIILIVYFQLIDSKILKVGEELWKETLPLQMGSRLYQLQGLKPRTWYEVKISYPASLFMQLIDHIFLWLFSQVSKKLTKYLAQMQAIQEQDLHMLILIISQRKGYMLKRCDNFFSFNSCFYFSKHESF
ncbi:hypothetical protein UlMin_015165 [Ulmus minor]